MQRIEVKNFGPLKDVSLDIKDYMIFIGPQASGKSTLAKLVYAFRNFTSDLFFWYLQASTDVFIRYDKPKFIIDQTIKRSFETFQILGGDYEIKFIFNDKIWLRITKKSMYFSDSLSDYVKGLHEFYLEKRSQWANLAQQERRIERELFRITAKEKFDNYFGLSVFDYYFIPAGRSTFSIVPDLMNVDGIEDRSQLNDVLFRNFNALIKNISGEILTGKEFNIENENLGHLFIGLTSSILKGDVRLSLEKGSSNNSKFLPKLLTIYGELDLKNASSGQQETFWMVLAIKCFLSINRLTSLIIEEPEAHLFPEAQRDLTYLISLLANQQDNQVLLTTHSPYILASLNNLLKAYTVGQVEKNKEAVGKIIDPLLWVNPDRVYVGYMENGEIRPILNPDLQQIEHDLLDNVSNDIMAKFDELLEIQYNQ